MCDLWTRAENRGECRIRGCDSDKLLGANWIGLRDGTDPHVPEADWVAVELQSDRTGSMRLGNRWVFVNRIAQYFRVVLHEHSILQNGHASLARYGATRVKTRTVKIRTVKNLT